jgi:hypothetical protein
VIRFGGCAERVSRPWMRITLHILDLAKLGETVPPRDPDDDDESEDEEDDDRNEDVEPAVIRERDE